ncbi:MAG TPA: lysylphosphatidylglycerol synthase transmembrane domain-containing protein [Magnetospirillaceae bacterium]|jgi:hypothetical protein
MNRWLSLALKLGITVLLFWLLLRKIDINAAWQAMQAMSIWAFVATVALLVVQLFICGFRWQMVVKALDAHIGLGKATGVFAIGTFFGLILPGAVGGDVVRMWATRRAGLSLAASINSVVLERVATVFALVLLVVVLEPLLVSEIPSSTSLWLFPVILVAMIVGTCVVMLLDRLPERIQHWRLVRALGQLAGDTRRLCLRPGRIISVLVVAVIGHLNLGLAAYALACGMHVNISVIDAVALFMPAVLIATLPISVAGWGAREAAMVTLYGFAGVPAAQALAISILYGLASTLVALSGGVLWLAERKAPDGNPTEQA